MRQFYLEYSNLEPQIQELMGANLKTMISEVGNSEKTNEDVGDENLKTMFSEMEIPEMPSLIASVSWSKNMTIIQKCKDYLERIFYIKAARRFGKRQTQYENHTLEVR